LTTCLAYPFCPLLERPATCTRQECLNEVPEFAELIKECWQHKLSARPSFEQVVGCISAIIEKYFPQVANYDEEVIRAYKEAQN
jgi:hypothetical protein